MGVSATFIRHFIQQYGVKGNMTTEQVCDTIITQATAARKCTYIDLLEGQLDDQGKPFTGPATVFVSHAWSCKTLDVFATMLGFADKDGEDGSEVFFWFDAFCNNQHDLASKPFEWFSDVLKDCIASIGTVLQVMTPWDDPVPLKRAWCLWETFCALEMAETKGIQLIIRLPPNQRHFFLVGISKSFEVVTDALVRIQAQRAEAHKQEDRDNIFKAIEESVGFNEVNVKVKTQLREWYLNMAIELAEEDEGGEGNSLYNIATVLKDNGELERAMMLYERDLETKKAKKGEDSYEVGAVCGQIAMVCRAQGQYDKALEHHGKDLRAKLATLGDSHPSTADTYNNMAAVYDAQGQYDTALEYYGKALTIRLATLGDGHPDTADTYNNMAVVYSAQGQHDKALEYYGMALTITLATLGDSHPDTANTYNNMANVL